MKQLKLDLDFDQAVYVQYKLNLCLRDIVNDDKQKDYMLRLYQQLNSDVSIVSEPACSTVRKDLALLEAGCEYYEISDFYEKYRILHSLPVRAHDVFLVKSLPGASTISRWSNYTVSVNWYIRNWGTMYQYQKDNEIVDQFRPDDYSLWAVDLEQPFQTVNLDYPENQRIHIAWLYKNRTLNQVLADWSSLNK